MTNNNLIKTGLVALVSFMSFSNVRASDDDHEYPNYTLIYPVEIIDTPWTTYPYDDSNNVIPDTDIVPEPSYLGLLGAGYLALRRRR